MTTAFLLGALALLMLPSARVGSRLPLARPERPGTASRAGGGRPRDGPITVLHVAADVELLAAAMATGLSAAHATEVVAAVAPEATKSRWQAVTRLLVIGAPAESAWAPMVEQPGARRAGGDAAAEALAGLAEVAQLARLSEHSGSAMTTGLHRIARDLRARAADQATAAAERAGIFIALPLAACFLPAFIVLGLAPIVISLAGQMLG